MSLLDYWRDLNPFVSRTTVRADPMNSKMGGISANLQAIVTKINGFVPKLPSNFSGNTEIQTQTHTDTLLYINKQGDMDLLPASQIILNASHEVAIIERAERTFAVNGDNHSQWLNCSYQVPAVPGPDENKIAITVGRAIRTINGDPVAAPGALIFFAPFETDAELWLMPDTAQGVSIITQDTLRARARNSAIALISLSETQWLLVGDIYPAETVVGP